MSTSLNLKSRNRNLASTAPQLRHMTKRPLPGKIMKVKFILDMDLPGFLWIKRILSIAAFTLFFLLLARPTYAECAVQDSCDPGGISVSFGLSDSEAQSCPGGAPAGNYNLCCYDDEVGGRVYNTYGARYSAREHANSFTSLKSAVCGSAIETIPSCASCGGQLNCYGYEAIQDKSSTDPIFENQSNGPISTGGTFQYNGTTYDGSGGVYFCNEDLFACGTSGCTANFDFEQPELTGEEGGPGESRLWFSQIRLVAALSAMAQTLFNPYQMIYNSEAPAQHYTDSAFSKNAPPSDPSGRIDNTGSLTTRVEEHQGIDDTTRVVNKVDNNSSLIVGKPAPAPTEIPFDFGIKDDESIYNDVAACVIPKSDKTQGDDLIGPKVTAEFMYTQKYEYESCAKPAGCVEDNNRANDKTKCCSWGGGSGRCHADASPITRCDPQDPNKCVTVGYKCGTIPAVLLPTKGKVSVITKNPLIEYIYKNIVNGEDSLFGRFMPSLAKEGGFEEIPAEANYEVSTTGYNQENLPVKTLYGEGASQIPTIYTPHLGSIDKYWLKDFQDAIRPYGTSLSSGAGGTTNGQCTTLNFDIPYTDTSVDPKDLDTLVADLRSQNPGKFGQNVLDGAEKNLRDKYTEVIVRSRQANYNPSFVLALWLEETAAGYLGPYDWGCGGTGGFDNQLDCFLGLYDYYSANSPDNSLFSCREGGNNPSFEDFLLFYSSGVCSTIQLQDRQFCGIHADFPGRVQSFYSLVAGP